MSVQVYGINHIGIEVDNVKSAIEFYSDVFGLELLKGGEGAAWCQLGAHQFMAIFEVEKLQPDRIKHFGLMVKTEDEINEVKEKLINKYKLEVESNHIARCDFHDPWGNHIQVVDLHDESVVWLLPYAEVQKLGITFTKNKK